MTLVIGPWVAYLRELDLAATVDVVTIRQQREHHGVSQRTDDQRMIGSEILGRVTSSRFSPTLDRGICLAQLRVDQAVADNVVRVLQPDGRIVEARVCAELSHVDPEGARARA